MFYPAFIWVAGKMFSLKVRQREVTPKVSIIIPAYNEEKHIQQKIENTLALNYPKDSMEILVGSDGSTDETASVVGKFADHAVRSFGFKKNRGKTAVQNDLVEYSKGTILVFTDAASFLPPDAVNKIVRNFADDRVGCVAGRMRFVDTNTNLTTESQGFIGVTRSRLENLNLPLGA
jgi:cellulose synthase/poly-beta-1,6-N-acetylglucosamine synthase-like glycosyltransferase